MRLLNTSTLQLVEVVGSEIPPYAILSHTWGREEISLQELVTHQNIDKKEGYTKIRATCEAARTQGLAYAWVDTCCIDKTSSAELTEAINSMFTWYRQAEVCYVYLSDVESTLASGAKFYHELRNSRWFSRGWTLQELIAPRRLVIWSKHWNRLANREDLSPFISNITRVPETFLRFRESPDSVLRDLGNFSIAERMSWAAHRTTTRIEDQAYCLLGIFNVNMPLLYGEGHRAFGRLQEAIIKVSSDQSIFAWRHRVATGPHGVLAPDPSVFSDSGSIIPVNVVGGDSSNAFFRTHLGLRITLPMFQGNAVLFCQQAGDHTALITIPLAELREGIYARVETDKLGKIYCDDWKSTAHWNWKTLHIAMFDAVQWFGPKDWQDIHALPGIHLGGRSPQLGTGRSPVQASHSANFLSMASDRRTVFHAPREGAPMLTHPDDQSSTPARKLAPVTAVDVSTNKRAAFQSIFSFHSEYSAVHPHLLGCLDISSTSLPASSHKTISLPLGLGKASRYTVLVVEYRQYNILAVETFLVLDKGTPYTGIDLYIGRRFLNKHCGGKLPRDPYFDSESGEECVEPPVEPVEETKSHVPGSVSLSTRGSNTGAHFLTPVGLLRMNVVPKPLARSFDKPFGTTGKSQRALESPRGLLPGVDDESLVSFSCSNQYSIEDELDDLLPLEVRDELVAYMAEQVAIHVPLDGSSQNNATTSVRSRALNSDDLATASSGHQQASSARKRRRLDDDDRGGDGGEERDIPLENQGGESDNNIGLLMACPYYKWKPLTHKNCQSLVLKGISRVKYHLWRSHDIPIHCPLCFREFPAEDERDSHVRMLNCEFRDRPPWDCMSSEQKKKIKKRVDPRRSKKDHWFDIFGILFPGYPLPESPYVDLLLCDELATLRDFISQRFGAILNSRVQEQLSDELRLHGPAIQQLSHSVFEYTLEMVLDQFQQQRQSEGSRSSQTVGNHEEGPPSVSQPGGNGVQSSNTLMPLEENSDPSPAQNLSGDVEAASEDPQTRSNDVEDDGGIPEDSLPGFNLHQYLQDNNYDLGRVSSGDRCWIRLPS